MKTYKRNLATRLINWWFRTLTKLGLGASYRQILTVPRRNTGRPHSTPVDVIGAGGDRWLVAGYRPASWVLKGAGALAVLALIAAFALVTGVSELVISFAGDKLLERKMKKTLSAPRSQPKATPQPTH